MDFDRLLQKREQLAKVWDAIPQVAKEKLERSFDIEYAHNSTALAGNSLTLEQTLAILAAVDPPQPAHQDAEDSTPSEDESTHQTM